MTTDATPQLEGLPPFAGKYEPIRVLATGGMGVVFEARHRKLGHRVAIKVLGEALREYPDLVARFEREARAAGSLSSPHAVKVYDIDVTDDGTPFIVMELLAGRDLGDLLASDGPQPVGRATTWILEACDALAEAHREGIVHRDVKPSNLFLADDGGRTMVKVLDFGIAKRASGGDASLTQPVSPLGTPHYMSPEQVRCARDVDARSDIWSLGATLYELVTGRPPFAHEEPSACIASIAADPVPDPRTFSPELPAPFVAVLLRMLEKDPACRFASVDELVVALTPFADDGDDPRSTVRRMKVSLETTLAGDVAESAPSPSRAQRALARVRRMPRSIIGVSTGAVLGAIVLVVTPKCVSLHDESATASAQAAQATAVHVSSAPIVIPEPAVVPAAVATEEAAPPATAKEPPPSPRVAMRPSAAPLKKPVSSLPPARPKSEPVATHFDPAPTPMVHGGLSSPGF
ncbi:MAG TPA: protein kinase [Labilithrix sp.]